MAVVEGANKLAGQDIGVAIKWPNDLYYRDQSKIGGVLCQSSSIGNDRFQVVVGVGINTENDEPTTCLRSMAKGSVNGSASVSRESVLAEFFNSFEELHDALEREWGFDALKDRYLSHWLHSDQELKLRHENREVVVLVKGLTPSGFLLAQEKDNPAIYYELHPDQNSLNFWEGFIVAKSWGTCSL